MLPTVSPVAVFFSQRDYNCSQSGKIKTLPSPTQEAFSRPFPSIVESLKVKADAYRFRTFRSNRSPVGRIPPQCSSDGARGQNHRVPDVRRATAHVQVQALGGDKGYRIAATVEPRFAILRSVRNPATLSSPQQILLTGFATRGVCQGKVFR